jgi:hypothetical protein
VGGADAGAQRDGAMEKFSRNDGNLVGGMLILCEAEPRAGHDEREHRDPASQQTATS